MTTSTQEIHMRNNRHPFRPSKFAAIAALVSFLLAPRVTCAADQKTFPTPDAAMAALIAAVKAHASDQAVTILGPELKEFLATRDNAQNASDRQAFLDGSRTLRLEKKADDPNTVIAYLGKDEWPFPAPLVKTSAGWKFDGKEGVQEIQDREIGRNELAAVVICRAYVDVQMEYFSADPQESGYLQFAQYINSTPGKFDGLYWSNANGEDVSPIGPFAAQAAATEKNLSGDAIPIYGYYLKILTAQGEAALGGARSYVENGRMSNGYALVAWPAEYGATGVATFIVNHLGVVYQKDLGADTDQIARAMNEFNPDSTWTKSQLNPNSL